MTMMGGEEDHSPDELDDDGRPVDEIFEEAVNKQNALNRRLASAKDAPIRSKKRGEGASRRHKAATAVAKAIKERGIVPGVIMRVDAPATSHREGVITVVSLNANRIVVCPLDLSLRGRFSAAIAIYNSDTDTVEFFYSLLCVPKSGFASAMSFGSMKDDWRGRLAKIDAILKPEDRYVDPEHPEYGSFWRIAAVEACWAELDQLGAAVKKRKG